MQTEMILNAASSAFQPGHVIFPEEERNKPKPDANTATGADGGKRWGGWVGSEVRGWHVGVCLRPLRPDVLSVNEQQGCRTQTLSRDKLSNLDYIGIYLGVKTSYRCNRRLLIWTQTALTLNMEQTEFNMSPQRVMG